MRIQQPIFTRKVRQLFYFEAAGEAGEEVTVEQTTPFYFRGDRIVADDDYGGRETTFTLHDVGSYGPYATWVFQRESVLDIVKSIELARQLNYQAIADKIERDFLTGEDIMRSELILQSEREVTLNACQPNTNIAFKVLFAKKGTWRASLTGWTIK